MTRMMIMKDEDDDDDDDRHRSGGDGGDGDKTSRGRKYTYLQNLVGWDSSVGIATRYGVDGPGIESQ